MAGSAIGAGEWITGPMVTAKFGGALLWLATLSILFQVFYNLEISRYALYSGEPIFTGKFRTLPGPQVWLFVYLALDFGSIFPYLPAGAATPLAYLWLGEAPDSQGVHKSLMTLLSCLVFIVALIPLAFGGKIYNSLRTLMTVKVFGVLGFLAFVALFFSNSATWIEIGSGFFKFGNVPIVAPEVDANGNGLVDPEEDWDQDGHLDNEVEERTGREANKFVDLDGDRAYDGDKVDNVFTALFEGRALPVPDLRLVAILGMMVAIAGQGGLSNTPLSNYTRDQGWGMGHHVGAIPSVVGGHRISLSHVGCVFHVTAEALARWKRWYRHLLRDQLVIWMPACFVGLALPCMLSVQFLRRGVEVADQDAGGMTAQGVRDAVAQGWGDAAGGLFWCLTLLCGLLVLGPTVCSSADGVVRRWIDVFWTASPHLQHVDTRRIRYLYFGVLCTYAVLGLLILNFLPLGKLLRWASVVFNFALGLSSWHVLAVNLTLLPKQLRPNWFMRLGLVLSGLFFVTVGALSLYVQLNLP